MSVSMITPPLALVRSVALAPVVECVAVLQPAAGEDRSAHEIRQPAELPKVARRQDVVVVAADLAVVVGPRCSGEPSGN